MIYGVGQDSLLKKTCFLKIPSNLLDEFTTEEFGSP
jgi:hypothetical protein